MAETLRYELALRQKNPGYKYGPWHVTPAHWNRPHPSVDWDWWHEDYDGPGDPRHGSAASRDDCIAAIHEWEDEHGE